MNRGLSNDSLNAADGDVFDRLTSELLHPNPIAIVVLMGHDDLRRGAMTVDALIDLYGHLITQLGHFHPTAARVVVSLPPAAAGQTSLNASIAEFNARLRELAMSRSVPFWDLHDQLAELGSSTAGGGMVVGDNGLLTRAGQSAMSAFLDTQWRALNWRAATESGGEASLPLDANTLGCDLLAAYGRECWSAQIGSSTDEEVVRHFIVPEIDYLVRYIATGAHTFRDLYVGSRAKFIAANKSHWRDLPGGVTAMAARDTALWVESLMKHGASAEVIARVTAVHQEIAPYFALPAPAPVKLLFIGDCLLEDVELMIGADLLRQGMLAGIDPIVSKNPSEQMREIRSRAGTKYAGIVYSPLSWEFDMDFRKAFAMTPRTAASIDEDIALMTERIDKRVRLLADLFDCNIYVHNTAAVLRASSDVKRRVRSVATRYKRERVREKTAAFLSKLVTEINAASFEHLYIVDEASAVRDAEDDVSLGRFLYYVPGNSPGRAERRGCDADFALHFGVRASGREEGDRLRSRQHAMGQCDRRRLGRAALPRSSADSARTEVTGHRARDLLEERSREREVGELGAHRRGFRGVGSIVGAEGSRHRPDRRNAEPEGQGFHLHRRPPRRTRDGVPRLRELDGPRSLRGVHLDTLQYLGAVTRRRRGRRPHRHVQAAGQAREGARHTHR